MLGNFVFPIVSKQEKCEELPFMQDAAPPRLEIQFVCGLTAILLFGGLGVEDHGFRQVRSYQKRFHFVGLNQRKYTGQNKDT
jgi:hypothetical protein